MKVSLPVQCKSSSQICPVPAPYLLPKFRPVNLTKAYTINILHGVLIKIRDTLFSAITLVFLNYFFYIFVPLQKNDYSPTTYNILKGTLHSKLTVGFLAGLNCICISHNLHVYEIKIKGTGDTFLR